MKIEIESSPTPDDRQIIWNGLRQDNDEFVSADGDSFFAVFLRREEGAVLGGILAKAGRGWLHIGSLWVHSDIRHKGYGRQLMATAETEACRRGCHSAYLDTFSFQAPDFYQKCGYEIFGTLEAFPDEHKRFFMKKSLKG